MGYQERDLPRGCSVVESKRSPRLRDRLLVSLGQRMQRSRQEVSRGQVPSVRRFLVDIGTKLAAKEGASMLQAELDELDEDMGLSRRVLLSRGIQDLKDGRLVLVAAQQIGIREGRDGGRLVDGGEIAFRAEFDLRQQGKRVIQGRFVGLIFNGDHELVKLTSSGKRTVVYDGHCREIIDAVVAAHKSRDQADQEGWLAECLDQDELERVMDWVITGE